MDDRENQTQNKKQVVAEIVESVTDDDSLFDVVTDVAGAVIEGLGETISDILE